MKIKKINIEDRQSTGSLAGCARYVVYFVCQSYQRRQRLYRTLENFIDSNQIKIIANLSYHYLTYKN